MRLIFIFIIVSKLILSEAIYKNNENLSLEKSLLFIGNSPNDVDFDDKESNQNKENVELKKTSKFQESLLGNLIFSNIGLSVSTSENLSLDINLNLFGKWSGSCRTTPWLGVGSSISKNNIYYLHINYGKYYGVYGGIYLRGKLGFTENKEQYSSLDVVLEASGVSLFLGVESIYDTKNENENEKIIKLGMSISSFRFLSN